VQGLRIGARFQPDVVEYQDPRIAGVAAYLTARILRAPLAGGVFNDLLDNPTWLKGSTRRRFHNSIGKFVLSRSSCVRCDSVETTYALNRKGFTQVRHIPFYVPWLERFAVPDEVQDVRLTRWRDDPVILCVARLSEEKNVTLLLRAFGQVFPGSQRGQLVVVGSGPLEAQLKHLATQLDIGHRVTWSGLVDYTALPQYYREADLFALTSDSETSARVLILAQASRLPTLTTDTSGSREIVQEGQTGYITPVGDVAAFVGRLRQLLNDQSTYQRMLYAKEYHAFEQHGECVITTQLKTFYDGLMRSAPACPRGQP
jgi:glycosyltransferase involved in cell wall biosynthesis